MEFEAKGGAVVVCGFDLPSVTATATTNKLSGHTKTKDPIIITSLYWNIFTLIEYNQHDWL
jgi:hypothetical protein